MTLQNWAIFTMGCMGKFFVFRRIQLKFHFWLYKKLGRILCKFHLKQTSNKKVIAKKPLINLYETNSRIVSCIFRCTILWVRFPTHWAYWTSWNTWISVSTVVSSQGSGPCRWPGSTTSTTASSTTRRPLAVTTWLSCCTTTVSYLTLCMLGIFFKYFFLSKDAKNHCFLPNISLIYNLNVKQFGSQMKPHILWGFIWIQIVCIGHQRSSKFTASAKS